MKTRFYFALIFMMLAMLFPSAGQAEVPSIKYLNRWPETAPNTITKAGDYVYSGKGEMISVYDAGDLTLRTRFAVPLTSADDLGEGEVAGMEGIASVFLNEGILYVACGSEGLRIYNVPENPENLGPDDLISVYIMKKDGRRAFVKDIYVEGNTAYIVYYRISETGYDSGLMVFDVTDKTDPVLQGNAQLSIQTFFDLKKAQRVVVSGDYAYVADFYNGLAVFDVSDPANPLLEAHYPISSALDVAVSGDYAYIASAQNGLVVVDVAANNFTEGIIDTLTQGASCVYADTLTRAASVRLRNGYAYVGDAELGLVVIDVSSPEAVSNSSVVGWYPYALDEANVAATDMAGVFQLYVDEEDGGVMVYAGDCTIGLQKIDVSDVNLIDDEPTFPLFVASAATPADADGLFIDVVTSYVYVVDDDPTSNGFNEGLRILFAVESENQITFLLKGMLATDGEARDVYVDGDFAYVADGSGGLKVIDTGLPPVDEEGNRATEEPVSPALVGTCAIPDGNAVGVVVKDGYAYVAAKAGGLKIIDVTDPLEPVIIGEVGDPLTDTRAVVVADHVVYVADGGEGLAGSDPGFIRVVDVSDKTKPELIGEFAFYDSDDKDDIPGVARDLSMAGDLLYVAAGNEGVQVINVSDPYNPEWYDQYNAPPYKDYNTAIFAVRPNPDDDLDLIWMANGLSRASMGFLSHPKVVPLQRIVEYYSAGNSKDVMAVGDYAYLADGAGGLHALVVDEGETEIGDWYDVPPVDLHAKRYGDSSTTCFIHSIGKSSDDR